MKLKYLIERIISSQAYPSFTHYFINEFNDEMKLSIAPSAQISRNCLLRGEIYLEAKARLGRKCTLKGNVSIGKQTNLEPNCELIGNVQIGKYCAIARNNLFQQTNHLTSKPAMQMRFYDKVLNSKLEHDSNGGIEVKNDVWIGTRSIILSGVTIGNGAIIGAGSIVTKDVEPYSVVAGVPAEHVKWRFPKEIREKLLDLSWWNWKEDKICAHQDFFDNEIETINDIPDVN